MALQVVRNRSDAEEIVQDSFVKIWKHSHSYRRTSHSPISWLARIARNTAIDKFRSRDPLDQQSGSPVELVDDQTDAEALIILTQTAHYAKTCLGRLDPRHASLITKVYMFNESYQSLASEMGIPLNTVRTWLRRGLIRTGKLMGEAVN